MEEKKYGKGQADVWKLFKFWFGEEIDAKNFFVKKFSALSKNFRK